jgi:hypothetical protein
MEAITANQLNSRIQGKRNAKSYFAGDNERYFLESPLEIARPFEPGSVQY